MFNVDSPAYMGAQAPGSLQPQVNTTDLLQLLDQYRQTDSNQTNSNDYGSNNSRVENLDFGGTMDYGDVLGGGNAKNSFDELVASYAGGGKVCGCK
jgi:hypothetical protein